MTLIAIVLLTALFFSYAERNTREWTFKRVGGLRFVRMGRLSFSYSIARR